ncbi:hypothetical protein [Methylorubrum salsuginis]|uniref:RNase H type-1 domain-containing protein n=1 Tax=Methylorubrum salsuginis TaxID=414703 RepID=A0A1I4D062_9HYPH|nr:hypothetical protein [Methylorubrum salsuginis]SFK86545.1 hypothetical protein SAMN04488125_10598 [Methylorubrum salsuginis]
MRAVTLAIRAVEREHDPGRRLLLAAAAALPFVPRPALAAEAHPDAVLLALKERWILTDAGFMRANDAAAELVDVSIPEVPSALFFREEDYDLGLHLYATQRADGRLWYVVGATNRAGRSADELRGPQMRVRTVLVEALTRVAKDSGDRQVRATEGVREETAALLWEPATRKQDTLRGDVRDTTNIRMELTAALEGVLRVKAGANVTMVGSKYVVQGMTEWVAK